MSQSDRCNPNKLWGVVARSVLQPLEVGPLMEDLSDVFKDLLFMLSTRDSHGPSPCAALAHAPDTR